MCKQIYHHYPSCGHIAKWTVESCIEFTNSLRGVFTGQIASCPKNQVTHDLLPLTHSTLCFQCEREWQREFAQSGNLQNSLGLGKGHMSIEGLGSVVPIVEVQVKSHLGLAVDQIAPSRQPVVHEVEAAYQNFDGEPCPREDWVSNVSPKDTSTRRRRRTPPLPPPRLCRFTQQQKRQSKRRKSPPKPILTNPYSHFDTPTPSTSSEGTIKEARPPPSNPKPIEPSNESPIIKTYGIYDWIPAPAVGSPSSPLSSSSYPTPTSSYSAAIEMAWYSPGSISASPLLAFLPRPEEYQPFSSMAPGNKYQVVDIPEPRPESFRNGLCIAFPNLFANLWATSQQQ